MNVENPLLNQSKPYMANNINELSGTQKMKIMVVSGGEQ